MAQGALTVTLAVRWTLQTLAVRFSYQTALDLTLVFARLTVLGMMSYFLVRHANESQPFMRNDGPYGFRGQ
jgi:hypothetical protein